MALVALAHDPAAARGFDAETLATTVRTWLRANGETLAGARVWIRLGTSPLRKMELLGIDDRGAAVEQRGLRFNVSWKALNHEGLFRLSRSLMKTAPADVHLHCLALGVTIGFPVDDEFREEMNALWKKDAFSGDFIRDLVARRSSGRGNGAKKGAVAATAKDEAEEEKREGVAGESDGLARHHIRFPKWAGHADVKKEYGAKGDGRTDDTAALQKAFNSNNDDHGRLIYLPIGTYLVSKKLVCLRDGKPHYGLQLIGEHRDRTIIKLKDDCPGFGDPAKPETMLQFSSRGSVWGNMAHWNSCWNLTLNTGAGNPGAIATNYYASNHGSMRDVTIRSGDGAGICGIDMDGPWPGPCLVARTQVIGFDYGIKVGTREYGVTFRMVTLDDQRKCAFWNHMNMVSVHKLRVRGCRGPAIQNIRKGWVPGMLSLLDSELSGRVATPAIDNQRSIVWLRNVSCTGYSSVMRGTSAHLGEYTNEPCQSLWGTPHYLPNLPSRDPPEIPWDPPEKWARGGNGARIQQAVDSGATTVCIPYGEHKIEKPIVIRKNVRRILGMKTNLWPGCNTCKSKPDTRQDPMWIFESTTAPALEFNFLTCGPLEHRAKSALVLRTMRGCAYSGNAKGCGPLYIEDICAGRWWFTNPIDVWAWQWNPECDYTQVVANGGRFWICGWKTEGNGTQFVLKDAVLEVFGALVYPHNMKRGIPMMKFENSAAAFLPRVCSYGKGPDTPHRIHDTKVIETRGGVTKRTDEIEEAVWVSVDPRRLAHLMKPEAEKEKERLAKEKAEREAERVAKLPPRLRATDEALRAWGALLRSRLNGGIAAGTKVTFYLASMRQRVEIHAVADDGAMTLYTARRGAPRVEMTSTWARLSLAERRNIALAVARSGEQEDIAAAAFFCLASGDTQQGENLLARVRDPELVERVRSGFVRA